MSHGTACSARRRLGLEVLVEIGLRRREAVLTSPATGSNAPEVSAGGGAGGGVHDVGKTCVDSGTPAAVGSASCCGAASTTSGSGSASASHAFGCAPGGFGLGR